ncbi:MAG: quinone-interacting membrane-bound oxidoreductase complex subunit QmoC [Deltaproteobacteria bacterium]|nr:quinone-interacting membrane-bound oxidoreductase complex subunit QmoC [Deltaproteobacteria bacterium]
MSTALRVDPNLDFVQELARRGGGTAKRCFQCATCSVTCELAPDERPFPRKEMLWASFGLRDRLMADPDVFLCYQCNDCTRRCPRGARPGDVLAAVRAVLYRHYAFPAFMGAALAEPKALLLLLLVPIAVLGALLVVQHGELGHVVTLMGQPRVTYHEFLKHGLLEALFIGGNVVIFLFALVGFVRFYRALRAASGVAPRLGFVAAALATVKEIIAHRRFRDCGANRPRAVAHMLVLFGFVGAITTAGLAVLTMLIWEHQHPGMKFAGLPLASPIKWLGVLAGLAMVGGSSIMAVRRLRRTDEVGADGYADRLFLAMILLVALTGLLTWLLRLAALASVAYPVYFVHLVLVFFLLWYMPYCKLAHMGYRTLALIWARQSGRLASP